MRVLYYNWTPLHMPRIGGGVAVYLENLINSFKSTGVTVLTSGYYYDKVGEPYIRKVEDATISNSFVLVNSPMPAPLGIVPSSVLKDIMEDTKCKDVFKKFVEEHGPFDVIHFQTLEGISPNVLSLKEKYPNTKFLHSIHDYGLFCPNVKFWKFGGVNCVTDNNLENCWQCMLSSESIPLKKYLLNRSKQDDTLDKFLFRLQWKVSRELKKLFTKYSAIKLHNDIYHSYREYCVDNINKYIDVDLAVSNRVKEIAIQYGIKPSIVKVSYIGTRVADNALGHNLNQFDGHHLTLLYMGYADKAKGFNYLVDALGSVNDEIASNVTLKFASKMSHKSKLLLDSLKSKYKELIIYNGYTHADFHEIFKGVNLGVVPPMWEDNLPQVTIEMIANGIPVIASSNGGAKELNDHTAFVFKDKSDFISKLEDIYKKPSLLTDYWKYSKRLTTMSDHINQLKEIYK